MKAKKNRPVSVTNRPAARENNFIAPGGARVEAAEQKKKSVLFSQIVFRKERLVADFTESLVNMLSAGITLIDSLEMIYREERNTAVKAAVKDIIVDLRKGRSFYKAVANCALFSPLYGLMIRAGEESGRLKDVLWQLQDYTRKNAELRENIQSALYYPAFLVIMSLGTVIYLVVSVLPQLFDIFSGFNAKLPAITLAMMAVTGFLRDGWYWILGAAAAVVFLLRRYAKTRKGGLALETALLRIPKAGGLYRLFLNINFFKPMGLMLKNRIHLNSALEIMEQSGKSAVLAEVVSAVRTSLKKGEGIQPGAYGGLVFAPSTLQMLSIGEKSGKLTDIVEGIDRRIAEKSSQEIKRMLALLEPILILIIGLVIGVIVMSALLPIYSISTMAQ